jgi:hypothetical protein
MIYQDSLVTVRPQDRSANLPVARKRRIKPNILATKRCGRPAEQYSAFIHFSHLRSVQNY